MKDYIEALREIKKENKDFKITLSRKEVLELVNEFDRLNNIIKIKTDFIEELLQIIATARDYELHDKVYTRGKIYEEKIQSLKGDSSNE